MGTLLSVGGQDLLSAQLRRFVMVESTRRRRCGPPGSMSFFKSSSFVRRKGVAVVASPGVCGVAADFSLLRQRRKNLKEAMVLTRWMHYCSSSSCRSTDGWDVEKTLETRWPPFSPKMMAEDHLESASTQSTVYDSLNSEMITVDLFPELNFPLSGNFYPKLVPLVARKVVVLLEEEGGGVRGRNKAVDFLMLLGVKLNSHIVAEVIKQLRNPTKAKHFFEWAENQPDFQGNSHTYNQVLWSVVNQRKGTPDIRYAYHLVEEMLARNFKPAPRACNLLVDRLCKEAQIDGALKLVRACKSDHFPDVVTYNSIINGLGKLGLFKDAFEQFQEMKQTGCAPNVITYNSVINALTKAGLVNQAYELFNEMSTTGGCTPDRITYNTLIYGLCNAGRWQEARDIWDEFPQKGIVPDVVTYNSLISGLFKCQQAGEALKIYESMISRDGCQPDLITYNILIDGLMEARLTGGAWKVLHSIEEQGWTANEITYNTMIIGLINNNEYTEVSRLVDLMKDKGCKPSAFAQRLLGCDHRFQAEGDGARSIKSALHRDGRPRIKMPP